MEQAGWSLMALRIYECNTCGEEFPKLKKPQGCPKCGSEDLSEVLTAPNSKFMEKTESSSGKSKLKDSEKVFRERARNHERDTNIDETIQINKDNKIGLSNNLLNEKGLRRRKIDDI